MKRINEYKKLFGIEKEIDLQALKSTYRSLVKEWHPDKFQAGDPKAAEAEIMSKKITDGYHFLISIAPETKASNLEEYTKTITESGIQDMKHKGLLLEVSFLDGTTYEYFGVNEKLFIKLLNSDNQNRFARRNVFTSYLYRKSKKDLVKEAV